MTSWIANFINSPVGRPLHKLVNFLTIGPKTTHFWGPFANWGFILAGVWDSNKPAD